MKEMAIKSKAARSAGTVRRLEGRPLSSQVMYHLMMFPGMVFLLIFSFAFAIQLLPPFTHKVQLWLVVHHYFDFLSGLFVESVAYCCVYGCRVLLVCYIASTCLFHVGSSGDKLLDIESGTSYR